MPILRWLGGTGVTSRPSTRMRPEVGVSKPAIMRRTVVLPQPEGPSREMNSPRSNARSTSWTTVLVRKLLVMPSRRRKGSLMSAVPGGGAGGKAGQQLDHAHRDPGDGKGDHRERRRFERAVGADVLHVD